MKQFLTALAAALFAVIASISFSLQANASSYIDYNSLKSSAHASPLLQQSSYYKRHSYYDDEAEDDYGDADQNDDEDEDDYRPRHHYGRKHCYTEYVNEYECEQPEPRCLRQRECVWWYGKEYCRYVRKCSRTEKSCHYVKVPRQSCW